MAPQLRTVLLVGPAQDDRAMYAEYLRCRGVTPIETDDPSAALAAAADADAVVTGIHLTEGADGLELIRRLRAADRTHLTPVIVLTASVLVTDRQRATAAGCDAFLPKPCDPDTLLAEIRRVMTVCRHATALPNQRIA